MYALAGAVLLGLQCVVAAPAPAPTQSSSASSSSGATAAASSPSSSSNSAASPGGSSSSSSLPAYFQTSPEIYQGPTPTGKEPFLRETNPAPFQGVSFTPPAPLETQEPIRGQSKNEDDIFKLMGNISPYSPSPGFGVQEFSIPNGSEIVWLNMLARHGSRYPTSRIPLGDEIYHTSPKPSFSGKLSWLNDWRYSLGTNTLNPIGRQELYDNGVLHNYQYGHLFNPKNGTKIVARSTTEDRMRKSAENFLAGFFGLSWSDYAKLLVIIDEPNFNNSLAAYFVCPNNDDYHTSAGANVSMAWINKYTANAVKRFNSMSSGYTWTATDVYEAQELCSYETIALGYSSWCSLFNYQEWLDFEYSIDLSFAGTFGFQSPTARALGIGYVTETLAKINHHLITRATQATGSANVTLDSMPSTFPTNQVLNFDFTHEVNLFSVLTAFSFTQFAPLLDTQNYQANRNLIVSHMVPFGCRLDIELIDSPQPIKAQRSPSDANPYMSGGPTTYIHFVLNQRTLPLYPGIKACGDRSDGYCELTTWMNFQQDAAKKANYNYSCYGNYSALPFDSVTNGAPPTTR